jgi:very-short-patch-repair endonuclease
VTVNVGCAWHAPCAVWLRPAARWTEVTMQSRRRQSPQQLRLHANAATMRHTPTTSEHALWLRLKGRQVGGVQFRRQVPWGSFILDFYAASVRLAVEVDGGWHTDRGAADERRDRKLRRAGLTVLRLPAALVLQDTEQAVALVRAAVKAAC